MSDSVTDAIPAILRDIQRRIAGMELAVRTHDTRLDLIERRITHLGEDLADVLTRRLIAFEEHFEARFTGIDNALAALAAHAQSVDARFDSFEARITALIQGRTP